MADQKFNMLAGFFDSINRDRLYTADQMNRPYKRVITNGVFATPAGTPSTDLQVLSANDGMKITVKKGEGLFADKWFENPSDFNITVPSNANINPRRDSVIVQVDKRSSGRIGRIVYREGTPAAYPLPPDLSTTENLVEYRVANIYVAVGATWISQEAIVDLRGSSECPWITSLIKQVDTSTLYDQWNAAYQAYYNQETERFNEFMRTLTQELSVNTNIITYESHYITTVDGTTQIPINISAYNKNKDVLQVYVNRLKAIPNVDYVISNDGTYITLTKDCKSNQSIDFLVLQSVVVGDNQTVLEAVQALSTSVSSLNTDVTSLKSDSGWINFTLESGTAFDDNNKPSVRKYGNMVNLRGAIKGVTATGTTICTLPAAYKPAMDYYFTTSAIDSGTVKSTVTMLVSASNGTVKLFSKSGTIAATDMISIATQFVLG